MTMKSQMEVELGTSCLIESYYFKQEPRREQKATFIHINKNLPYHFLIHQCGLQILNYNFKWTRSQLGVEYFNYMKVI